MTKVQATEFPKRDPRKEKGVNYQRSNKITLLEKLLIFLKILPSSV